MKLYYFPLSTYCQKVMIALHEKGIEAERVPTNLMDESARAEYRAIYPLGKIPLLVLEDGHRIPESSIIIEYLDTEHPGRLRLIPDDPTESRQTRFHDRMLDLYLNDSITTLLFQSWKPAAERDPQAIETAKARAAVVYGFMESRVADRTWMMGESFTLADCAAAPPLLYARDLLPFTAHPNVVAYWERLAARASWRAVMAEVEPHLAAVAARSREAAAG